MDHKNENGAESSSNQSAKTIWIGAIILTSFWILLIASPAILTQTSFANAADSLYSFFNLICHQNPARSFEIFGEQLGVCARCTGVYSGLVAGLAIYPLFWSISRIHQFKRRWLFLALVPLAIDWALTFLGIWENTYASRFLTGLLIGAVCSIFLMPAFVEVSERFFAGRTKNDKN